jgi:hypothetical protein
MFILYLIVTLFQLVKSSVVTQTFDPGHIINVFAVIETSHKSDFSDLRRHHTKLQISHYLSGGNKGKTIIYEAKVQLKPDKYYLLLFVFSEDNISIHGYKIVDSEVNFDQEIISGGGPADTYLYQSKFQKGCDRYPMCVYKGLYVRLVVYSGGMMESLIKMGNVVKYQVTPCVEYQYTIANC